MRHNTAGRTARGLAPFVVLLWGTSLSGQQSALEIERALYSTDTAVRYAAALDLARLPTSEIGPSLRTAVVNATIRQNLVSADFRRGVRPVEDEAVYLNAHLREQLITVLTKFSDPEAIPALVGALDTGLGVIRALAGFGEPAVSAVLPVVGDPPGSTMHVVGGLVVLRFLIESDSALSSESVQEIRDAAELNLRRTDEGGIRLRRAISLALVLDDPDLRRMVDVLATSREAVVLMGVVDDGRAVERVQRLAREGLSGVPPLPRP